MPDKRLKDGIGITIDLGSIWRWAISPRRSLPK